MTATSQPPGAYPILIAEWTEAAVRALPPPGDAAGRSLYRAALLQILEQQLHVSLAAAGDPRPWRRFTVRSHLEVPRPIEFTAAGWARLDLLLIPDSARRRHLRLADLAFWQQSVPARVPMPVHCVVNPASHPQALRAPGGVAPPQRSHRYAYVGAPGRERGWLCAWDTGFTTQYTTRLSQAVDGSLAAVEWQIPAMPPPRLESLFAHGAVSPIAPRPAELRLSIPAALAPAAAGAVAEPVTPFAEPPASPSPAASPAAAAGAVAEPVTPFAEPPASPSPAASPAAAAGAVAEPVTPFAEPPASPSPAASPAAAAGAVAEPVTPFAEPPASPSRQRSATPRSLAIRWYLIDPDLPYLRFSGRWLARLGFTPGRRANVAAEPGRIVLTLAQGDAAGAGPAWPAPPNGRAATSLPLNRDARVPSPHDRPAGEA
jgi:hypothetical protein